jgi:hypothetical protein
MSDTKNAVVSESRLYSVKVQDANGITANLELEAGSYLLNNESNVVIKGTPRVEATYDTLGNLLTAAKPEVPDRTEVKIESTVTAGLSTGFAFPMMTIKNSATGVAVIDVYKENAVAIQVGSNEYLDRPSAPECSFKAN